MRIRTLLFVTLAGCLLWAGPRLAAEQSVEGVPIAPIGKLVDAGGHELHLHCTGEGSPTVVLDTGAGDFSFVWALVQPAVAKFTRVCSYDRAGYAWSDPGPQPRTLAQIVYELHAGLAKAGVKPPHVLAGASLGGLIARVFANTYPGEVAGMVLVDSAHEDAFIMLNNKAVRFREMSQKRTVPPVQENWMATAQTVPEPLTPAADARLLDADDPRSKLPVELQRAWRAAQGQKKYSDARQGEFAFLGEELESLYQKTLEHPQPLQKKPLVVLAREVEGYPKAPEGMTLEQLNAERKRVQNEMGRLSTNSKVIFVKGTRHEIHLDQPETVAASIRETVEAARNGTSLAASGPQLPDIPAARQFGRWLEVFNRGDRPALKEFFEKYMPDRAARLDQDLEFRERTGGFELQKVEESAPTKFTALVKERNSDQFARLTLEVDEGEPYRVTNFGLRAIPRPADFPLPRATESEALAALRARLDQESASDRFAGAVLVGKNGKPIFTGAYGLADRDKKVANTLPTRFRLGSMNKMFTAVAVAQLAQAGKVRLTDPLGKYITGYPNADVASKVTIHHLLTHTGGTGDIFGPQFEANRANLRELKDYVALYGKRGLEFEPGSKWAYSNYGFVLLGVLIERVSGQSYYDYVNEHIFKPAGMTSTGSLPESEMLTDRSVGYTKSAGVGWHPNTDTLPYRGTSAGGGYSTVEDLMRFSSALLGDKLLNAEYTDLVTTGKIEAGRGKYAYGFGDSTENGVRWFGHGGGAPGMNGDLKIFPASGYVVAVLANMDSPAASRISDFIAGRLPAK